MVLMPDKMPHTINSDPAKIILPDSSQYWEDTAKLCGAVNYYENKRTFNNKICFLNLKYNMMQNIND